MVKCEECGKKLSILRGYRHPTMGKKYLLCSSCFDTVEASVDKWREFVLSNSLKIKASKTNSKVNWQKIKPSYIKIREIFHNV